jgi:sulfur-carrier protein adenylyltransferase/sulfurtransferase
MQTPLEILPEQLLHLHSNNLPFVLIDVRTLPERNAFNIGGQHTQVSQLLQQPPQGNTESNIIFYCAKGIRSSTAAQYYRSMGYSNAQSLKGGMGYWLHKNLPQIIF